VLIGQNLRRAARIAPDRLALVSGPHERTWRQLLDRVSRLASGLRGEGLEPGDRVAILSNNSAAFFELYFAAPWAGLIMASLNSRWSVREMIEALEDCAPRCLIVDAEFAHLAEALQAAVGSISIVIQAGDEPNAGAEAGRLWDDLASASPIADAAVDEDAPAYLFYTGGTTGRAKGVILSARNFHTAGLSSLYTGGYSEASVISLSVPMFHMSGGGLIAAQMAVAAAAHIIPRFEPVASMAAVAAAGATHVVWVPTMLSMLLDSPAFGEHDLSSLQRIFYGSAPMPPSLIARALAAIPGVSFTQYYGMTEVTGNATWLGPEVHTEGAETLRLRSVGRAVPGVEVKVVGASGKDAAPGEVGEICIRGPTITQGYWNQPEKTAEAIVEGWMRTGDLGHMDAGGFVFLVDRMKDMIISGGENVYSSEVENALYQHPAVRECAVIGEPDEKWGEIVSAVIYAEDTLVDATDLIAHCRALIAGYKLPKRLHFSAEPLPKSAAGKILKAELRQRYALSEPGS
jgi:long-chain acyl-CoA synthetase